MRLTPPCSGGGVDGRRRRVALRWTFALLASVVAMPQLQRTIHDRHDPRVAAAQALGAELPCRTVCHQGFHEARIAAHRSSPRPVEEEIAPSWHQRAWCMQANSACDLTPSKCRSMTVKAAASSRGNRVLQPVFEELQPRLEILEHNVEDRRAGSRAFRCSTSAA